VAVLRAAGHEVYDFRNPKNGEHGFHWSEIDKAWQDWTPAEYKMCLSHEIANYGFNCDFDAMKWADVCVLVLPCGRSAHTEAGWMKGVGKPTIIYMPQKEEPELMYKIFDKLCLDEGELLTAFTDFPAASMGAPQGEATE